MFHRSPPALLVVISTLVLTTFFSQVCSESDCMYNICNWKLNPGIYSRHEPCMNTGNRDLVRDVECSDGNTIHICCRLPYREDVLKSRQKWFRAVIWAGDKISNICTKRVLCEQACKDGLSGRVRSDYPQVLPGDNDANKEFVESYTAGENLVCYKQTSKDNPYNGRSCEVDCQAKYLDCDHDLDHSYLTKSFYESARIFHKMGMWCFSAYWIAKDTFVEAQRKGVEIGQAVKKGFGELCDRMSKLENLYKKWLDNDQKMRKRRSITSSENWNQFLTVYNETDPVLVDRVYDSLNYTQYSKIVSFTNETLFTYDFGSGEWIDNRSNSVLAARFPKVLFLFGGYKC